MERLVIGLFDKLSTGQEVVEELVHKGITRDHIHLLHAKQADTAHLFSGAIEHESGFHKFLVRLGLAHETHMEYSVPEHVSRPYSEGVRRGGTLVAAAVTSDAEFKVAEAIFKNFGAVDMDKRAAEWRNQTVEKKVVPTAVAATAAATAPAVAATPAVESTIIEHPMPVVETAAAAPAITAVEEVAGTDLFENELRAHHGSAFASAGKFEHFLPAYRLGADLYATHKDWPKAEIEARKEWQKTHPETWDKFKDAIHFGWERAGRIPVMQH